jgi:hypothetical protein
MNIWTKPAFIELCMNAEIGAYQEDNDDTREPSPILAPARVGSRRVAEEDQLTSQASHVA